MRSFLSSVLCHGTGKTCDRACELQFTPSAIRRPAYFDGLLKVLQVLNIDYDMADLSKASAGSLNRYKQVWAFSTDEMNAADQQAIVDYTNAGGNVVLFPYLPDREMSQKTMHYHSGCSVSIALRKRGH